MLLGSLYAMVVIEFKLHLELSYTATWQALLFTHSAAHSTCNNTLRPIFGSYTYDQKSIM